MKNLDGALGADADDASAAPKTIGARIQERRIALGLSRRALARTSGISIQAIVNWEAGTHVPAGPYLRAIAKALGVSEAELTTGHT